MSSEWTVTQHQGKLAICLRPLSDWNEPKTTQFHIVSTIPAADYPHLAGQYVYFSNGVDVGRIYQAQTGTPVICDVRDWERVTVETPIAKPRDGKEYTWTWGCGKWGKDYFPRCDECYHYHDPAFAYCEDCGHCHKPGKRCKTAA